MNNSTKIANTILQEQGYVIMAFHPGPKPLPVIGDKLTSPIEGRTGELVDGPFFVIGTATAEEFIEQARKYASSGRATRRIPDGAIGFFKLIAE